MAIVPDSKDWAWVLERPCPVCGFDARAVDGPSVAARLRTDTDERVAALSRPDVSRRPAADRWSDLEYGCHARNVFSSTSSGSTGCWLGAGRQVRHRRRRDLAARRPPE